MSTIKVNLTLYGSLATHAGGKYIAQQQIELTQGACIRDLLDYFQIPYDQKSYLFINAVLCDMPGLMASLDEPLHTNDRVGIFSLQHMWPYQYRDGIRMSDKLTQTLHERDAIHNVY